MKLCKKHLDNEPVFKCTRSRDYDGKKTYQITLSTDSSEFHSQYHYSYKAAEKEAMQMAIDAYSFLFNA